MVGETLGSYRVLDRLGEGGMGEVYTGEHILIGKRVAIKMLLPALSKDTAMVQRFFNEARAATRIRHPGIVEVFDFGHHVDGSAYIVMEFLDGEPLSERLRRMGRMSGAACARLLYQIAGALGAAHESGITHRDLKPDNIFIVPDPDVTSGERIKVLDFGIAKLAGDMSAGEVQTRTGAIIGTPRYMAPEQCRGAREVDHRADLYALGCIAFEMLCGRPPFLDKGLGELFAAHMFTEPPRPTSLDPSVPTTLEAVVLRLLAKEPDQRFPTAAALADALDPRAGSVSQQDRSALPGVLDQVQGRANTPTTLGTASASTSVRHGDGGPTARRTRLLMGALASMLAGLGVVALVYLGVGREEMEPSSSSPQGEASPAQAATGVAAQGEDIESESTSEDAANRWIRIAPPPAGQGVVLGLSAAEAAASANAIGLRPAREALAPAVVYEMQQHEVTWGELDPWLAEHSEAVVHQADWVPADAAQRRSMPASGIPWETAYAYCRSIGGRLPSEAEWEYAARGPQRRPYPWGRERLDTYRTNAYAGEGARMVPVMTKDQDRTPGEAGQALYDMMGNAREWVADLWRNDRPGEDESWVQSGGATFRPIRGLPVAAALPATLPAEGAAYRDALCASDACLQGSESVLAYVGFRCTRDVL